MEISSVNHVLTRSDKTDLAFGTNKKHKKLLKNIDFLFFMKKILNPSNNLIFGVDFRVQAHALTQFYVETSFGGLASNLSISQ